MDFQLTTMKASWELSIFCLALIFQISIVLAESSNNDTGNENIKNEVQLTPFEQQLKKLSLTKRARVKMIIWEMKQVQKTILKLQEKWRKLIEERKAILDTVRE